MFAAHRKSFQGTTVSGRRRRDRPLPIVAHSEHLCTRWEEICRKGRLVHYRDPDGHWERLDCPTMGSRDSGNENGAQEHPKPLPPVTSDGNHVSVRPTQLTDVDSHGRSDISLVMPTALGV